jgi:hypothetical protein
MSPKWMTLRCSGSENKLLLLWSQIEENEDEDDEWEDDSDTLKGKHKTMGSTNAKP